MVKGLCCGEVIKLRGMVIFLGVIVTLIRCVVIVEGKKYGYSKQKILEAEKKLSQLRKPAVETIQSEDGDIIDCIDICKQPAFDHPALKNHTIQMAPTYDPNKAMAKMDRLKRSNEDESSMLVKQKWRKSGSCPQGTIPVRRIRKMHLLRANLVEEYGRKKHNYSPRRAAQFGDNKIVALQQANHSKAILLTEGYRYMGAKGDIRVYTPYVELHDEYTTSHVCLLNGPYYAYEAIQAGWAVNPSVYGDKETRLFVHWTADGSKKTGCFDLTCPGFVQTSHEIALGAAIDPISGSDGLPFTIIYYIFKDPVTNNWWVEYGERINIGYWPAELFAGLCYQADCVEWGGEVYSTRVGTTPHTKTGMGSGQFTSSMSCGTISRIRIHDNSPELKFPEWTETYMDEFNCYDVWYIQDYVEDPDFLYGGPGRNYKCP